MGKEYKGKVLNPPARIGIIGGGQLGKMIAAAAKRMGYWVTVLDPTPSAPAAQVSDRQITAGFMDRDAVRRLVEACDVTTFEFEHIDSGILMELETAGHRIYPSGGTLQRIQDKHIQKTMLKNAGIPIPDFTAVDGPQDMERFIERVGLPVVLKTRTGGYDGKGNCLVESKNQVRQAMEAYAGHPLMAEQFIAFDRELSVIAARSLDGGCTLYPVAENIHRDSILYLSRVPASAGDEALDRARAIARKVLEMLDDYGVYCIEMFLTGSGDVYVNEIAPRPHNSGHYTIEACVASQYEQLVRVITGMPLGSTQQRSPCVMVNILGGDAVEGAYGFEGLGDALAEDDVHVHLYGKATTSKQKKIGHITALDASLQTAEKKALRALEKISIIPSPKGG